MRILFKIFVFIVILILLNGFYGCKKDFYVVNDESEHCECEPYINLQDYNPDYIEITDTSSVFAAEYNPLNNDEIIFLKLESNIRNMYRFNLVTHQKYLIGSFPVIQSFDWGKNDWILLELGDLNVWKMKSNGDSLIQLTSGKPYFHPKWNFNSTKISVFYYINPMEEHGEILTADGLFYDSIMDPTIYNSCLYSSWRNSSEMMISYQSPSEIRVVDLNQKIVLKEKIFNSIYNITQVEWLNDNEAIVNSAYGLYKYNFQTNSIVKLRCQCPQLLYQKIRANIEGNKLLMTRVLYEQIDTSFYFNIKYEIVELDLETMIETVIDVN